MKISELIVELEKAMVEHGDVPVYYWVHDYGVEEVTEARFEVSPTSPLDSTESGILVI